MFAVNNLFHSGDSTLSAVKAVNLYKTTDTQCQYARILGATWGVNDVTRMVGDMYNKGTKVFEASSMMFGTAE